MKIVQLGANGRTGRKFMRLALEAGDSVTAMVRSADSLSDMEHDRLRVHAGNVCDARFLKRVLPGHDAVISTLGPRTPMKSACAVYPASAAAIVEATQATGLSRVLFSSTALLFEPNGLLDRAVRLIARNNRNAADVMEERLRTTSLEWTSARVGFLTDDDETRYRKAVGAMPERCRSISRSALAAFLFDELKRCEHVGDIVGLCRETEIRAVSPL